MTLDKQPNFDKPTDDELIETTETAIRQRSVKRILAESDPNDILAAAKVLTSLPGHVRRDKEVEWESLDERVARALGEVGTGRTEG
jgi:hypothetical protein